MERAERAMEDLVTSRPQLFENVYCGKRVLVTGHTGFKGSWLSAWLMRLGAEVRGYALPPPTDPNHFDRLSLGMQSVIGDVRDREKLQRAFEEFSPDIVFHLAAQPIVRRSYEDPVGTFTSNSLGTMHMLEACRALKTVRAVIVITSDKCYENREWSWGYRENDRLGGDDPYSASKACAELIAACWRTSFFSPKTYGKEHRTLLATVRAGNVLGGGDWAADRIIPDIARAASAGAEVLIRNPLAIRPWQHVLEPLDRLPAAGATAARRQAGVLRRLEFRPFGRKPDHRQRACRPCGRSLARRSLPRERRTQRE